jgi:hypothetical protein
MDRLQIYQWNLRRTDGEKGKWTVAGGDGRIKVQGFNRFHLIHGEMRTSRSGGISQVGYLRGQDRLCLPLLHDLYNPCFQLTYIHLRQNP